MAFKVDNLITYFVLLFYVQTQASKFNSFYTQIILLEFSDDTIMLWKTSCLPSTFKTIT